MRFEWKIAVVMLAVMVTSSSQAELIRLTLSGDVTATIFRPPFSEPDFGSVIRLPETTATVSLVFDTSITPSFLSSTGRSATYSNDNLVQSINVTAPFNRRSSELDTREIVPTSEPNDFSVLLRTSRRQDAAVNYLGINMLNILLGDESNSDNYFELNTFNPFEIDDEDLSDPTLAQTPIEYLLENAETYFLGNPELQLNGRRFEIVAVSAEVIPEPTMTVMVAMSSLALLKRRRCAA